MTSGAVSASHLLAVAARRLEAAGIPTGEARTEARLLLLHTLGVGREELVLRPERAVSSSEAARFEAFVARRARREPLAYLTGKRAFYGLEFVVSPAVLIPRPETELLVEATLHHLSSGSGRRVADVGTGSGAIAVAVARCAPDAHVWASDISPDALGVARRNAGCREVHPRITFVQGDALAPLAPFAPFDVIVSNPPYIAASAIDTLMPEVRDWEPRIALGVEEDPFFFYKRFALGAPALLAPGGLLVVEVGADQAEPVAILWRGAGLEAVSIQTDYAGIGRVVRGVKAR